MWNGAAGAGKVIGVVHRDLCTPVAVAQLEALADAWLEPRTERVAKLLPGASPVGAWTVDARWTVGGKAHKEAAEVAGGTTTTILTFRAPPPATTPAPVLPAITAPGPRVTAPVVAGRPPAELTFNVALTDRQRDARAQVVLPYLAAQQPAAGSVVYHADSGDDIDEDDPDDDLEV